MMKTKRRNTPATQKIMELLKSSDSAQSQDMIEEKLQGSVNRVTIYRILNRFCEDGITHKVVSEDGKNFFALCRNCGKKKHFHNHFHFQCIKCEKVECLEQPVEITLPKGYDFINMNAWISGICKNCD